MPLGVYVFEWNATSPPAGLVPFTESVDSDPETEVGRGGKGGT